MRAFLIVAFSVGALALMYMTKFGFGEKPGTYFRLKVALTYKQQPVDFDIVVGCNVRVAHDLSGGNVTEVMGMVGFVFAREIPDGHAISVLTVPPPTVGVYSPCLGATTANGKIPKNWLPIVVWYDRAEDLSHGVGYATQDAYLGPNAHLSFGGATVERATKAEFDVFTAREPRNLIPPHLATNLYGGPGAPRIADVKDVTPDIAAAPWKAWRKTGWLQCDGTIRIPLSDDLRAQVRRKWPADRPDLWPADSELFSTLQKWMSNSGIRGVGGLGMYQVSDSGKNVVDTVIFPSVPNNALSRLTASTTKDEFLSDGTDLGDLDRSPGMVSCDRAAPPGIIHYIMGSFPISSKSICRINGREYQRDLGCDTARYIAIIRDEYILTRLISFVS